MTPSIDRDSESLTAHFCDDDLRVANHGTEWWNDQSLIPFRVGMTVVERIGADRYLSVITHAEGERVRTTQGHWYTLTGEQIGDRARYRSLLSPFYALKGKPKGGSR